MNKIIVSLFLVLVQTGLMAQSFAYEIDDDHFQTFVRVVGPDMESESGSNSVSWKIIGTVDRETQARDYIILWWTVYRQNSITYREYNKIILPGAISINGHNMSEDRTHANRQWRIFEMWATNLTEQALTTLDVFRFYAKAGPNVDGAMPPGYVDGLMDVMMEVSEGME